MVLVMHTKEDDTVFHIEKTGMLMLVVEVDVGGMTADVVDKLNCSSDDVQPRQVDLRFTHALTVLHWHYTHVDPDRHEVNQRAMKISDGKSASTPIDTEKPLLKDPDGEDGCAYLPINDWFIDVFDFIKTRHYVCIKRIFRYLKGKLHLGLWYPKDLPFNLVAYSDSDYVGASLDRKSTTGGCQFLGCRLISWQCKKQTVVATSSTMAEYVVVVAQSSMKSLKRNLHVTNNLSSGYITTPQMVLNLPCLTHIKNWLVQIKRSLSHVVACLLKKKFLLLSQNLVLLIVTVVSSKLLLFDASEGFDQIIDFLNASSIKYAVTVNPNIYVSCIKRFWSSVSVKKVNDVTRLQALVDKKKVIITEATIRDALRLDDAESIDCLPNEEIFTELSRMGGRHETSSVLLWLQLSSAFQQ
nr:putative ribonuclease H-like domain-containing protein [Tanacetum cinerariifolium]